MELIWIPISILAALMQAVRTAAQKDLNRTLSVMTTTYVRSLFGLPVILFYFCLVLIFSGNGLPEFNLRFFLFSTAAAISQVLATVFLIQLFGLRNFAVGTALSKTDVMMTALIGSLLFSESISGVGWTAIVLTVAGVIMLSIARIGWDGIAEFCSGDLSQLTARPVRTGLLTGFFFCLSYLFLREASLSLAGSFLLTAACTVAAVTSLQVILVGLWLFGREGNFLPSLLPDWKLCSFIGLTSAVGSICWFLAMTMQNASYVKAVGQVETIFTLLISYFYFQERISFQEVAGIVVIVSGVLLFLL